LPDVPAILDRPLLIMNHNYLSNSYCLSL
jgi:hypothetical protein